MDNVTVSHILIFLLQIITLYYQWKWAERRRKWNKEDLHHARDCDICGKKLERRGQ